MKIFKTPFATQGDRVAVPDEMQSDGSVSYTQGYSQDYEKEYDKAGAKDIERSKMNAIFHDITDAIGKGQSTGIYPWIKEAAPYAKGSFVYYNKEAFYSLVDNNSDTPADGAKWRAISKKQDALTFTGTGDVVRKSVTDALDGRVATAQSSADSALQAAQSKQDKLEFVGSGKVMKEGAYGIGGATGLLRLDDLNSLREAAKKGGIIRPFEENVANMPAYGVGLAGFGGDVFFAMTIDPLSGVPSFAAGAATSVIYTNTGYTSANTRTDKSGVLHATTGTPLNTLNVSDMAQEVVNRDDITVTSGAVFRADNALSTRITTAQSKADSAQSKADSAHSLAASKTTEAWVKSQIAGSTKKWTNVTSQRSLDTNYTNNESYPIFISVMMGRGRDSGLQIFIDDILVFRQQDTYNEAGSSASTSSGFFVVPAGSKYKVAKSGSYAYTIEKWSELR